MDKITLLIDKKYGLMNLTYEHDYDSEDYEEDELEEVPDKMALTKREIEEVLQKCGAFLMGFAWRIPKRVVYALNGKVKKITHQWKEE